MKHVSMFVASAAFVGALVVTNVAQAQYVGPSNGAATTVAEILKNPVDDTYVQLKGSVIRQVGGDKYIFADKTGEIRVEIDKHIFAAQVSDKTVVEIRGEVEKDFMESPEIDVDSVVAVKD